MISFSPLFKISNGSFTYGKTVVFDAISLSLKPGAFYGLIGPNGSGKSTLIDILMGISRLHSGTIEFRGKALAEYPRKNLAKFLSLVPQSITVGFDFSVHDIVLMGRHPHMKRFSPPSDNDLEMVDRALLLLDIKHLQNRLVTQLSGGEKQRVIVARALAQDTDVLILDEATSNLDIEHTLEIMRVLQQMVRNSEKTVIAAIHDLNLAAAFCDHLVVLKDQNIKKMGSVKSVLTEDMIKEVFSVRAAVSEIQKHLKVEFEMHAP